MHQPFDTGSAFVKAALNSADFYHLVTHPQYRRQAIDIGRSIRLVRLVRILEATPVCKGFKPCEVESEVHLQNVQRLRDSDSQMICGRDVEITEFVSIFWICHSNRPTFRRECLPKM